MIGKILIAGVVFMTAASAIEPVEPTMEPVERPGWTVHDLEVLRAIPELAWHAAPKDPDCSVQCWDQHAQGVHTAIPGGSENETGAGSHWQPFAGSCADNHPVCEVHLTAEMMAELERAVDNGDVRSLQEIILVSAGEVYVAAERNAIQVLGCSEEVVAHIDLPDAMLSAMIE